MRLTDEHQPEEELLNVGTTITPYVDVPEHEAQLESYRFVHEIRHDRRWHRQCQFELEAAYKEMDEATDELFSKSDDEEDIANSVMVAPRHHDHEADTSATVADNEE
ncbi:hypothetical protein D1007_30317 [Hordeum vulgare]|nr:hypothetical protein D1007_30317 [Hordeum vulgare]